MDKKEETMRLGSLASNLRRARAARGMTQAEVAQAAGISLAAYRNIETRKAEPRVRTIEALAAALDSPVRALVVPVPELRTVRFRSFKRLKTREQILADVGRWLHDFNELEELLGDHEQYSLGGYISSAREERRSIVAAGVARQRFELSDHEPVRDICGLLAANGIKILSTSIASDAFFGLSVAPGGGGPAIVVNTWERISVERWIFTAAHELGHLVLHSADYQLDEAREDEGEEREANLFAAHFLMPRSAFDSEWHDTYGMPFIDRVLKIKRIFRVSYLTVLHRLAEDATEPASVWRTFQANYKRRYGKTLKGVDEPDALAADAFLASSPEASRALEPERLSRSDFLEDRLSRLVRTGIEKSAISLSRGAEILGLSSLEMRQLTASWVG